MIAQNLFELTFKARPDDDLVYYKAKLSTMKLNGCRYDAYQRQLTIFFKGYKLDLALVTPTNDHRAIYQPDTVYYSLLLDNANIKGRAKEELMAAVKAMRVAIYF